MTAPTCATCRWWNNRRDSMYHLTGGTCRIRSVAREFPTRLPDDWCGEHAPSTDHEPETRPPEETWEDVRARCS